MSTSPAEILLINPGNGALNALATTVFGFKGPIFTLYSLWSLIAITALAVVPAGSRPSTTLASPTAAR